jgi:hypothetical protein
MIGRIAHHLRWLRSQLTRDQRGRLPLVLGHGDEQFAQLLQARFIGEINARRILALLAIQQMRQGDGRMRHAALGAHGLDGIGHQALQRHGFIDDLVDEGRVGAVFQQAAHQVGQQGLVRPTGA